MCDNFFVRDKPHLEASNLFNNHVSITASLFPPVHFPPYLSSLCIQWSPPFVRQDVFTVYKKFLERLPPTSKVIQM
jgi:hypothetical protein